MIYFVFVPTRALRFYAVYAPSQLDFTAFHLAVGLSPYKNAIINAPASKLAERYYYIFARLVAYAKYLFNRPSNALPCLASSLAIS